MEKALMWRTFFAGCGRLFLSLVLYATDNVNSNESKEFIDEGDLPNAELAQKVYPYATNMALFVLIARIVLIALQLKWMWLTKLNFYFN